MRSFVPWKNCLKGFLKWFAENQMKSNIDKCNLLVSASDIAEIQKADFSGKKKTVVKSCWMLTLTVNLILIVMLTIYAVKQVEN